VGSTYFGTSEFANSIPSFFKPSVSENPLQQLFLPRTGGEKWGFPSPIFVGAKGALSTDNSWLGKYLFFFATLCAERIASMGFSRLPRI
jgi:hypothetical protein